MKFYKNLKPSLVGVSFVLRTGYFPHILVRNVTIPASILSRHLALRGHRVAGTGFNKETKTADRVPVLWFRASYINK